MSDQLITSIVRGIFSYGLIIGAILLTAAYLRRRDKKKKEGKEN